MFFRNKTIALLGATLGLVAATHLISPKEAEACGCFVPPDPSVPIVQAGERILFGIENGVVTSHVQIQYAGSAEEFGWLLPLPSIPEMELGTDEVFNQLIAQTQPIYRLDRKYEGNCPFDPSRFQPPGASPANESDADGKNSGTGSPLVLRDTIGPYDFAVLRADEKAPMLEWLDANGFFVPAGTDDVVGPYIRPGSYFLALKLLSGNDVGDLQPVVVKYKSDLPMIPIILTSVAADPDMGVQVWVVGDDRAIPRNYHHTRINDAAIDWLNAGQNYAEVVTDAVDEIEGHHSFVTEYAGPSSVMVDILDYQGRFGSLDHLATLTDPISFVEYLNNNGFPVQGTPTNGFQQQYSAQLLAILQRHLAVPVKLLEDGISPSQYYQAFRYYVTDYRQQAPEKFEDLDLEFVASVVAAELDERFVTPTLEAGALFRKYDYLSRLFTTLSPNEMTKDPVFSFNPDLPEVSNEHVGELTYYCSLVPDPTVGTTPAVLKTEQGFELAYENGTGEGNPDNVDPYVSLAMPQSQYQDILAEEGQAEVVADHTDAIKAAIASVRKDDGGCSVPRRQGAAWYVLWIGIALVSLRRRCAVRCDG